MSSWKRKGNESGGRSRRRTRRRWWRLCRQPGASIAKVARDLGLTETAVRRWVAQAEVDSGRRTGLTTTEREELSHLRQENRVLREERDLLKRAMAFFARETR